MVLTTALGSVLQLTREELRIEPLYQAEGVWAGLVGRACERVTPNRGGPTLVAPLHRLPRGLMAWIGFREMWEASADPRLFTFRQIGLSVHFGHPGDPVKPQAFRSEWPGVKDWTGAGLGFQAPGAGHPHWQVDVLETLWREPDEVDFDVDPADGIESFSSEPVGSETLLRSVTLERIHFASAASWWAPLPPTARPHQINAPEDEAGLTRWLVACIGYVKQELARIELR